MGTTKSSESLAFAEYLRTARGTTQAQEDEKAREHAPQLRYTTADRHAPSAH